MAQQLNTTFLDQQRPAWTEHNPALAITITSALMLFLELCLIRFLPAHIMYLGFFTNFVLMAAFLGIGSGFLLAKQKVLLILFLPALLAITVISAQVFNTGVSLNNNEVIFFHSTLDTPVNTLPPYVILPLLFILLTAVFSTLGQYLSLFFQKSNRPLETYIYDILGSILGIIVFYVLSFLRLPPFVWFALATIAVLTLLPKKPLVTVSSVVLMIVVIILSFDFGNGMFYWSPYQRITFLPYEDNSGGEILTNNIHHQYFSTYENAQLYRFVFSRLKTVTSLDNVLVIGSGTGQDINAALHAGAKHIDAVEIDPQILAIGQEMHPDQPYSDLRVTVHNTDGRNFLHNTTSKYDLIDFALTDSLILNSGFNQVRLESYIFTVDAFKEAKDHLKPGGVFTMYNDYRTIWLINRLGAMMKTVFQTKPDSAFLGETGRLLFVKNVAPDSTNIHSDANFPTDDWPFPYLKTHSFPSYYLYTSLAILTFSILLIYTLLQINMDEKRIKPMRMAIFFLLGAAFSLLETKSLAQMSLLFGSTWIVNGFAFGGILLMVLLASLVTLRSKNSSIIVSLILFFVSLAAQFLIPIEWFLTLSFPVRLALGTLYFFLPIFFANLFFARIFKESETAEVDFGSNILGLVFGGVTEYFALVSGYKSLTIIAAIFYIIAAVLFLRSKKVVT